MHPGSVIVPTGGTRTNYENFSVASIIMACVGEVIRTKLGLKNDTRCCSYNFMDYFVNKCVEFFYFFKIFFC